MTFVNTNTKAEKSSATASSSSNVPVSSMELMRLTRWSRSFCWSSVRLFSGFAMILSLSDLVMSNLTTKLKYCSVQGDG